MTAPSLRARARSTGPRTSSTATAPARSRTRSATAGCSPPTPRTCPRRRCSAGPRRRWRGLSNPRALLTALAPLAALDEVAEALDGVIDVDVAGVEGGHAEPH